MYERFDRRAVHSNRWELSPKDTLDLIRLHEEFRKQAEHPEGGDIYAANMNTVFAEGMEDAHGNIDLVNGYLVPVIEDMVVVGNMSGRPLIPSAYAIKTGRAFQTQIISPRRSWPWKYEYPRDFADIDVCREVIQTVLTDDDALWELAEELVTSEAHTNVSHRYEFVMLMLHLYGGEREEDPTVLDAGAGVNQGLKKLGMIALDPAYLRRFPFPLVEVVDKKGRSIEELGLAFNALLAKPPRFGGGMGVEAHRIKDEMAKSHAFRPVEWYTDARRVEEFDDLISRQVKGVGLFRGEFSERGMEESYAKFAEVSPYREFDFVTFLTMMNQNPVRVRKEMLDYAKRYLRRSKSGQYLGRIGVQDFAYLGNGSSTGLRFAHRWTDWSYRSYVYHPHDGYRRPEPIAQWQDSRCHRVRFTPKIAARILELAA